MSINRFAEINLNHPTHYLSIGPFSVSIGNLSMIIAMVAIFTIALFAPFPEHRSPSGVRIKREMHQ